MFIEYTDLTDEVIIDVRSFSEFNSHSICNINVPIINESDHRRLKMFYPSALFIILYKLFKNRKKIRNLLLRYTDNGNKKLAVVCSRARLRSPIMCLYAKYLGINCKVISKGIKGL